MCVDHLPLKQFVCHYNQDRLFANAFFLILKDETLPALVSAILMKARDICFIKYVHKIDRSGHSHPICLVIL